MKAKTLKDFIEESTKNVEQDRALASKLLYDLIQLMDREASDKYVHKTYGEIASKYLETLQRSNEQLVKLAGIVQKQESSPDGMSKEERDALFDVINTKDK